MDTVVAGHPVDIKWSANRSGWQIPTEAVGHICLLVSGDEKRATYEVGLVRCRPEYLNKGKNKDQKTTLSALGRISNPLALPRRPCPQLPRHTPGGHTR